LSERDGNEDQIRIAGDSAVKLKDRLFTACKKGMAREIEEGRIVRGHTKLFMLQMNPQGTRQPENAVMTENTGFGNCQDAASSIQHIFLPSLKIVSGR
jgi:hypothetical protein